MLRMIDWERYTWLYQEKYFPALSIELPNKPDHKHRTLFARLRFAQSLLRQDPWPRTLSTILSTADLWCEVPLLVAQKSHARITSALLGRIKQPQIVIESGWLKTDAKEQATKALSLAGRGRCGFILLCGKEGAPQGIAGNSLGLPLAVFGRSLSQGKCLPTNIFLTGALNADESIGAVGSFGVKYEAVTRNTQKNLFFYPQANTKDVQETNAIPVQNLEGACALCDLAESGLVEQLVLWRNNPQRFFAQLAAYEIPANALDPILRIAESEHWKEHLHNPELLGNALCDLWKSREDNKDDPSCAHRELNKVVQRHLDRLLAFFPDAQSTVLNDLKPLPLLYLACMHIKQDNHKGSIDESPWFALCDQCLSQTKTKNYEFFSEAIVATVLSDINALQIHYAFHKPLPKAWLETIQEHASYCTKQALTSDALGKAFGALVSYAAFQGKYDQALAYCEQSLRFWPHPDNEIRRLIEKTYIFCEMGDLTKACESLSAACPQGLNTDNPYLHASYARLCRAKPTLFAHYPTAFILKTLAMHDECHPWQCWATNCGHLLAASDPALAHTLFRFAIDLCIRNNTVTSLTPMALLPLAALLQYGLEPEETICHETTHILSRVRKASLDHTFHQEHFAPLFTLPTPRDVLTRLQTQAHAFFPFTCR